MVQTHLSHVLIVDPDAGTRLLYRTALASLGARISEAEDGVEALGKALCEPPAVIVTETRLPRLDGLALCSSLRRNPTTAHIPIVVASGAASAAARIEAHAAGADAVFVKPYPIHELVAAVRQMCRDRDGDPVASRLHLRSA